MSGTILVVDDEPLVRKVIRQALESSGYRVVEASDGDVAIDLFQKDRFDLIIMDISMPRTDGLTATRLVRQLLGARHLPIIAITSASNIELTEILDAGCTELLRKPFTIQEIEAAVKRLINC